MEKKSKIAIIIAVVIGIAIVGGVMASKNKPGFEGKSGSQPKQNPDLFTQEEMETFCQEDYLVDISGYFKSLGVNYAMINVLNYNAYFDAEYQHTMDEAKRPVALLSWNGKNKDTDAVISFMCWATKIDGQKKLLLLETSGQTIRGDAAAIYGE